MRAYYLNSDRNPRFLKNRYRPMLELLEDRLAPATGLFHEDFTSDLNATLAGFDLWDNDPNTTLTDQLQMVNDLPRYGAANEGPTGRNGYYAIQQLEPGTPGGGLLADGYILGIISSNFQVPQVTFTVPPVGAPGGLETDEEVSSIGISVRGFGRVVIDGANGSISTQFNDLTWRRISATRNDLLPGTTELGAIRGLRVYSSEIVYVDIVSVQVTGTTANRPPTAVDDTVLVNREFGVSEVFFPLQGDYDLDGDHIEIISFSQPARGVVDELHGGLRYRANADALNDPTFRSDSFTYVIRDSQGATDSGTVTLNLNHKPLAVEDRFNTPHGGTGSVFYPAVNGLLGNDFDRDGDVMTARLYIAPQHGNVTINPDGSFTYTSTMPGGFIVQDHFQYIVNDGIEDGNSVTAQILPVNSPPSATSGNIIAPHNAPAPLRGSFTFSDADGDQVAVVLVNEPEHGRVTPVITGGHVEFLYETAERRVIGPDRFVYKLFDGYAYSDEATVEVRVPNNPPVAISDHFFLVSDFIVNEPLFDYVNSTVSKPYYIGNNISPVGDFTLFRGQTRPVPGYGERQIDDHDPDGDRLTFRVIREPESGQLLEFHGDTGEFYYQGPRPLEFPQRDVATGEILENSPSIPYGYDSFVYEVSDGYYSSQATVLIDFVPGAPALLRGLKDDAYDVQANQFINVPEENGVLQNDGTLFGGFDFREITGPYVIDLPQHGVLTEFNSDGSFIYVPDPGFVGVDSFMYLFSWGNDRHAAESVHGARVSLVVRGNNSPPEPVKDDFWMVGDRLLSIPAEHGLLVNDSDRDGQGLRVDFISSPPAQGTILASSPDGAFTYEPEPGFRGNVTFQYQVSDGVGGSFPATVTIHVDDPANAGDYVNLFTPNAQRIVMAASPGTTLVNTSVTSTPPGTPPPGLWFPLGYIQFEVHGLLPGGETTVRIILPPGVATFDEYWKYGKRFTFGADDEWYSFPGAEFHPGSLPGDEFYPAEIRLHLRDGDPYFGGDNDLTANGVIRDPGGPAIRTSPAVERVIVNHGQTQRSKFYNIQVLFNDVVSVSKSSFELYLGNKRFPIASIFTSTIDGKTVATLQFTSKLLRGWSFPEGEYRLVIKAQSVRSASGATMTANHTDSFFRLFGDVNGDSKVDSMDQAVFSTALGKRSTQSGYLWYLDYDGNGRIDHRDQAAFLQRKERTR